MGSKRWKTLLTGEKSNICDDTLAFRLRIARALCPSGRTDFSLHFHVEKKIYPVPGGTSRYEAVRHIPRSARGLAPDFGLWTLDFGLWTAFFPHGPTRRQYPAIPGNTRTKVQFL